MNAYRLSILGTATLMLTACASTAPLRFQSTEQISDLLIEQDKATIERQLGEPRSMELVGPNTWEWRYHSDTVQHKNTQQGKCELIITFENNDPVKAVVNSTEYSPFVHELKTCNELVKSLK